MNDIPTLRFVDNKKEVRELYHRTDLLLRLYRKVIWNLEDALFDISDRCMESVTPFNLINKRVIDVIGELDDYLMADMKELEDKLRCISHTRALIEIIDKSLNKLRSYPTYGELYYLIIFHRYIAAKEKSEEEMLRIIHTERTTYYKRKKEAIQLFGIILWGFVQPDILNELIS